MFGRRLSYYISIFSRLIVYRVIRRGCLIRLVVSYCSVPCCIVFNLFLSCAANYFRTLICYFRAVIHVRVLVCCRATNYIGTFVCMEQALLCFNYTVIWQEIKIFEFIWISNRIILEIWRNQITLYPDMHGLIIKSR